MQNEEPINWPKHVHHGCAGQAECPWALWSPSWHGWHTSWCPQTNPPSMPPQLPEEQEQHGSGTSNPSATKINQSIDKF